MAGRALVYCSVSEDLFAERVIESRVMCRILEAQMTEEILTEAEKQALRRRCVFAGNRDPRLCGVRVLLDGVEQRHCVACSEDEGWLDEIVVEREMPMGVIAATDERGEVLTRRRTGRVELRFE